MSGKEKSQTYSDRLKEFLRVLEEYSDKVGTNSIQYNDEVQQILLFTTDDYKGLSSEDSYSYACVLEGYSLYLIKEYNRHKNILKWAERNLKYVISEHWYDYATGNYDHMDIIKNQIIKNSRPAQILNKIIEKAEGMTIELENMSTTVGMYAGILKSMAESKRWKK